MIAKLTAPSSIGETTLDLLRLLSDGQFHSGNVVAATLGVSRTAIWKQVKLLEAIGLEVFSVRGKGYRIPGGVDLIDGARLEKALHQQALSSIECLQLSVCSGSTNSDAMDAFRHGYHRALCVTEQQTQGRGRRGRTWASPFAANLCFSLAWRFSVGVAALEGLSLVVGMAIRSALAELGLSNVTLKWPNDVLVELKKLAGVLIEVSGDTSIESQVVIGIGVNVAMPAKMASEIDQPWTDLRSQGLVCTRTDLLIMLLKHLLPALSEFEKRGFAHFKQRWNDADAFKGQVVCVKTLSQSWEGVCQGVNDSGALLLKGASGLQALHGGELSVRLAESS